MYKHVPIYTKSIETESHLMYREYLTVCLSWRIFMVLERLKFGPDGPPQLELSQASDIPCVYPESVTALTEHLRYESSSWHGKIGDN